MKCAIHKEIEASTVCSQCNTALCDECISSYANDIAKCSRCVALSAAADFGKAEQTKIKHTKQQELNKVRKKEKREQRWHLLQLGVIAAALVIIPTQLNQLFKQPEPRVVDKNDTEEATDYCTINLWRMSLQLQLGLSPSKELRCPFHNRPYVVTETGNDIVISDPNPELHGLSELKVSKKHPKPVIID